MAEMIDRSRSFHEAIERWRRESLITSYSLSLRYDDRFELEVTVRGDCTLRFQLSDDELNMDGAEALDFFLATAEREIRGRARHAEQVENALRVSRDLLSRWQGHDLTAEARSFRFCADPAAEARSEKLFAAVAGEAAFRALRAGEPFPITGSSGTPYHLYRRASYCVERPADGARLCAVVPGVPLWDHLLGIKLMVERDEPAFLRVANISGRGYHQGVMMR